MNFWDGIEAHRTQLVRFYRFTQRRLKERDDSDAKFHGKTNNELLVNILEPDSRELLQTPHSFPEFLTHAATDEADVALSLSFYRKWLRRGSDTLALQHLAAYVPLRRQMLTYPPGAIFNGGRIS